MLRIARLLAVAVVAVSISGAVFVQASGGSGGGGGGGGGGGTKPLTIRWTGTITSIVPVEGGYSVTLGTSYYAVGTGLVTDTTKVRINGVSDSFTGADLLVGDYAEMTVLWPSRVVTKIDVTGVR